MDNKIPDGVDVEGVLALTHSVCFLNCNRHLRLVVHALGVSFKSSLGQSRLLFLVQLEERLVAYKGNEKTRKKGTKGKVGRKGVVCVEEDWQRNNEARLQSSEVK